jgi:hypothetical protein
MTDPMDDTMLLFAVRHALNGGAFRAAKVAGYLERHWPRLDEETQVLIARDIRTERGSSPNTTRAVWDDILDKVKAHE